ncbi:uncharacterized protein LOC141856838 [Brevipalpus obovatus]|uniref:uncharacterized protein LOC141856838 n=1 Tax=Brevipalpus obovatus TaxID=246614 RepID=UPI003D9EF49B
MKVLIVTIIFALYTGGVELSINNIVINGRSCSCYCQDGPNNNNQASGSVNTQMLSSALNSLGFSVIREKRDAESAEKNSSTNDKDSSQDSSHERDSDESGETTTHQDICPIKDDNTAQGGQLIGPYEGDCRKFIHCSWGVPHVVECPPGLAFNPKLKVCDTTPCDLNVAETTTTSSNSISIPSHDSEES